MGAPIIAGATLIGGMDIIAGTVALPPIDVTVTGIFSSLIMSILTIRFLQRYALTRSFSWFALYLCLAAILLMVAV